MPIVTGKSMWASITKPNTTYEPVYSINLVVDDKTAKKFANDGYKVQNKPVSWSDEELPTIVIKRKVNGPGFTREAPELVSTERDDNGSWKAVSYNVGNGSEVNVKYKEWTSERNGETYKGLDLQKVQVISLVAYGDDEDFEDNEDF